VVAAATRSADAAECDGFLDSLQATDAPHLLPIARALLIARFSSSPDLYPTRQVSALHQWQLRYSVALPPAFVRHHSPPRAPNTSGATAPTSTKLNRQITLAQQDLREAHSRTGKWHRQLQWAQRELQNMQQ